MNKYEIMDMIDEGAYGIVWKAVNKETGMLVAIKQFKEGDDEEISRKSIQRQIRMLKMLKGEFIVNIKEAFKKKNKIFLIFQYFPKNLLNFIEVYDSGLDPTLINKISYKIVKCLRFLHQKNIIHRDIKPENILLQNDADELKLCDFGFARFLPQPYEDLTEYVATRWYRSPELLVGEKYGKPADIWALGCIIGQLVDGHPMFPGQNEMDQLYLIRKAMGQLPSKQTEIMSKNPKFKDLICPPLKKLETIEARYIGKIQKNALSFLKACLVLDPAKRITVDQALQHPYLLPLSIKQNEHINQETNILYSSRKLFYKNEPASKKSEMLENSSKKLQKMGSVDQTNQKFDKTEETDGHATKRMKYYGDKPTLKHNGSGSLPETSIYKVIHQPHGYIQKKNSEATLKYNQKLPVNKTKNTEESSPQLKLKKTSFKKMQKVMSEEKKMSYNIDVKLNINLKINEKLGKAQDGTTLLNQDRRLPQIKNTSKMLKYRLNNNYPGQGINTIYNSYGNLSILGESKSLSKGFNNLNQIYPNTIGHKKV